VCNTTPLCANQSLAHRHPLVTSRFLIQHVKGSFFLKKQGKNM
jgi:hypothetical protein